MRLSTLPFLATAAFSLLVPPASAQGFQAARVTLQYDHAFQPNDSSSALGSDVIFGLGPDIELQISGKVQNFQGLVGMPWQTIDAYLGYDASDALRFGAQIGYEQRADAARAYVSYGLFGEYDSGAMTFGGGVYHFQDLTSPDRYSVALANMSYAVNPRLRLGGGLAYQFNPTLFVPDYPVLSASASYRLGARVDLFGAYNFRPVTSTGAPAASALTLGFSVALGQSADRGRYVQPARPNLVNLFGNLGF